MALKYMAYRALSSKADFRAASKGVLDGYRSFKRFWKTVSDEYSASAGITAAVVLSVRAAFDDEKLLAVLKGKLPKDYYDDLAAAVRADDNEAIAELVNEIYEEFSDFDVTSFLNLL